jgi:vacuolar protein sorting-associated protein 35
MAEEQGWIARLVHLFRSDDDETQFKLLQTARMAFAEGGDRIRWTFPPLIVAAVKLARRRRAIAVSQGDTSDIEGDAKASTLFRFIHQGMLALQAMYESSWLKELHIDSHLYTLQLAFRRI